MELAEFLHYSVGFASLYFGAKWRQKMARQVCVSTELHSDPKFYKLVIKLGSTSAAYGALVQLWIMAQKYWFPNKLSIPKDAFSELDFGTILIETKWVEITDDGFLAAGSEKHFNWIFLCQEAGKRGGRGNKITHLADDAHAKKGTLSDLKDPLATKRSLKVARLTSTITLKKKEEESQNTEKISNSHSDSDESAHSLSDAEQSKTKTPPEEIHPLVEIWNANCGLFPRVASVNPKRKRLAAAAWRENSDPEFWIGLINHAKRSEFLTGRNDRGWVMNFDFLLRPDRRDAVLEGHYHKVGANNQPIKILSGDELPDY